VSDSARFFLYVDSEKGQVEVLHLANHLGIWGTVPEVSYDRDELGDRGSDVRITFAIPPVALREAKKYPLVGEWFLHCLYAGEHKP